MFELNSFVLACLMLSVILIRDVDSEVSGSPRFTVDPVSAVLELGSRHTLRCMTDPKPDSIHWFFNDAPIEADFESGIDIARSALVLTNFQYSRKEGEMNHVGKYHCVAHTPVGVIVSKEAYLRRAYIGRFEDGTVDYEVRGIEDNTAIIACPPPRSIPQSVTSFEHNGTVISISNEKYRLLPSGNLQINHVTPEDGGAYQCKATNPVSGQTRRAPYKVTLTVIASTTESPPMFISTPQDKYQAVLGESLTLECAAEGYPVPTITWKKYGGQLPQGRVTEVDGNLVFASIDLLDEGTYICSAENGVGNVQSTIAEIDVLEPPSILEGPTNQAVSVGEPVTFKCSSRGNSKSDITWLYNGNTLTPSPAVIITDMGLTLESVSKEDAGIYQCLVSSKIGSTTSSAILEVLDEFPELPRTSPKDSTVLPSQEMQDSAADGTDSENTRNNLLPIGGGGRRKNKNRNKNNDPPEEELDMIPPTKPEVDKLSDTSVMLTWMVPEGGMPITFFKVQYKEMSANSRRKRWRTIDEDIASERRTHEVAGLKSGRTYRFRIMAVFSNNDNLQSPTSDRFELLVAPRHKLPAPGSGPVIVEVRQHSSNALFIRWQYLRMDTSPIEGFHLYYKPYHASGDYMNKTILQHVGQEPVRQDVLVNLKPNTQYSIFMKSFNSAGTSEPSNKVAKSTLAFPGDDGRIDRFPVFTYSPLPPTTSTPVYEDLPRSHFDSQSSSDMLYMILGVVLGVMLLLLIIFMAMCAWKQRQQRRMLAALQGRNKFHDPSKVIYVDSLRKPHQNGDAQFHLAGLNGRNGRIGNGHGPPKEINHYQNEPNHYMNDTRGSDVNINVNPMGHIDGSVQYRANNSPPDKYPEDLEHQYYEQIPQGTQTTMDPDLDQGSGSSHGSYSIGQQEGYHYGDHGHPEQLSCSGSCQGSEHGMYACSCTEDEDERVPLNPHQPYQVDPTSSYPPPPKEAKIDNIPGYRVSLDHIPRSHERLPHHRPLEARGSQGSRSNDQNSEHSYSSSTRGQGNTSDRSSTRDQATNTDSDEGTLDKDVDMPAHTTFLPSRTSPHTADSLDPADYHMYQPHTNRYQPDYGQCEA